MNWIDADQLADIVYPMLAAAGALTSILAFGWHFVPTIPKRQKHPLNLLIGLLAGVAVIPALLASATTGADPSLRLDDYRIILRLSWLFVAGVYFLIVAYYVRRFWLAVYRHKDFKNVAELA